MNVLVTGGAGFIGTHLVRRLLREKCSVAILDSFNPQIHGTNDKLPGDLADHVEVFKGDVRDSNLLRRALSHRDALVHFAAETGTGQSMYEVARYQDVNIGGTAAIIDYLANTDSNKLQKIVLASSRAVYGEGRYHCVEHGAVYPNERLVENMRVGRYEPLCPICNVSCAPVATPEDSPIRPTSFYGLTKQVQEEMILMFARARGLAAYVLRYQNVFGPGQSLHNPYTGILAIFSGLARTGAVVKVFEDGRESRDFVFVDDVVEATWQVMALPETSIERFNVGTGKPTTVLDVAEEIVRYFGTGSEVSVTGAFRRGDIRHNFADLTQITNSLGFSPKIEFREGLRMFLDWTTLQSRVPARYEYSLQEMRERGLLNEG